MEISAQLVKELRERTGAGIMDCRKALVESEGSIARAEALLREKGMRGPKDPTRETNQGLVEFYRHANGQLGAIVELLCETDFVSRTEDFGNLAREIALHIAAANPLYREQSAIPADVVARERAAIAEQLRLTGTTEADIETELPGRVENWVKEVALLDQPYVRDPKRSIRQLILEVGAKTGENVRVGRFARFKIGE
ncbi:MAG TPA: elongation factor Ts [Chloroflexota bacterium]|nr:elongation factor Ts [Chloroflexota bacterium]